MMFSKTIKKLFLIVLIVLILSLVVGFYPKDIQAMLLREKSLRESFFTKLVDEAEVLPGEALTQTVRFNYDNPLGIEIIFRNPFNEKVKGSFSLLRINKSETIVRKEFFLEPNFPVSFYFFAFPEIKEAKGNTFLITIDNKGTVPFIVGYYNQNVYHYGDLFLGKNWQEGVLQFQIHYQISPIRELLKNFKYHLGQNCLFFVIWLVIIIFMALMVIVLAKKYRIDKKKK